MALPKPKSPITETDVLRMLAQDRFSHLEIVNGEWHGSQELPMTGEQHGAIQAMLMYLLMVYVLETKVGKVYPADLVYVLNGDEDDVRIVRKPDVSFVRTEHLKTEDRAKPYYQAPDLAIEIISPSESASEIRGKLNDYLRFGTQQVWVIHPDSKQVEIHFSDGTTRLYNETDMLGGGDTLPGFTLSVASIFDV